MSLSAHKAMLRRHCREVRINALNHALEDTIMVSGSEAFDAARIFYRAVQNAAKSNASGSSAIYNDLKTRFPGKKGGSNNNNNNNNNQPQ